MNGLFQFWVERQRSGRIPFAGEENLPLPSFSMIRFERVQDAQFIGMHSTFRVFH